MSFNVSNIPLFGNLSVRVGGSLTGKTDRIIDNLEIESRKVFGPLKNYKRVLLVRPDKGKFKEKSILKSHSSDEFNIFDERNNKDNNLSVCVLEYSKEDALLIRYDNYNIYFIDEGHLYSERIASIIQKLIYQGKDVYFTARKHDSSGKIYPTTLKVMLLPEVTDYKVLYNQRRPRIGKPELKIRVGPMFSTKTKKVIRKAKNTVVIPSLINNKLILSPAKILIVRPGDDLRFDDKDIFTTHAGRSINFGDKRWHNIDVVVIPNGDEETILYTESNLIIFDEGQFFNPKIATVILKLLKKGKEIYFTSLLHDFTDEPFPTTKAVMSLKEVTNIRKLWAQCGRCQKGYAFSSARLNADDKIITEGPQVMIGDDEFNEQDMKYIAIHKRCKMIETHSI